MCDQDNTSLQTSQDTQIASRLSRNVDHILNYYEISEKYEAFREFFKERRNFYFNYFYFFFGEHYESIINNVNFFHYATEAIILEILKKRNRENAIANNNWSYDEMTDLLNSVDINQQSYYESIKLLTGSCYIYDPASKISEMKIASEFLRKFVFYKELFFNSQENTKMKNEDFKEKCQLEFELIFNQIAQMSASATIAELGLISSESGSEIKNDLLYNSFQNLNSQNIILMNFIKLVEKELNSESESKLQILKQTNILSIVKMFYFFSKTSLADYLKDLELYNSHSCSLFKKIKKVSLDNYNYLNSNLETYLQNSKTFGNLRNFYQSLSDKLRETNALVKSKFHSFKYWINESIKSSPDYFYDKYSMSKLFLYNKILMPSKNIIILYTDKYITFLMTNLSNVKKTMNEVSHYFLDKAELFMTNFENKINEKELCVRFSADEEINFIKIDLDNTVMMINPKKFKEYAENIYSQIAQNSFEFYEKSKSYFLNKYRLFLGEDEKNLEE